MKLCRLCCESSNFVKAHAIPEAFFRAARGNEATLLQISGVTGELRKKVPIGIYDSEILCSACEQRFQDIDAYGVGVLLTEFEKHFRRRDIGPGSEYVYESTTVNLSKVMLFLAAILWRASVSSQLFYRHVSLGPEEQALALMLRSIPQAVPTHYDILLSTWDYSGLPILIPVMLDPRPQKIGSGLDGFRLYLDALVADIKIDRRPFGEPESHVALSAGAPCRIMSRILSKSKEFAAIGHAMAVSDQTHAGLSKSRSKRGAK